MDEEMEHKTTGAQIASYWNRWAVVWNPLLRLCGLDKRYRREAVSVLELKEGMSVLDVACGTGLNFPYLFEGVGQEGRIIAVDISPRMLEKARRRAKSLGIGNIEFILSNVSESRFPEVDATIACWSMVSIPDYRNALRNVVDSLRRQGKIAILDFKLMGGFSGKIFNPLAGRIFRHSLQDVTREPWHDLEHMLGDVGMREWKYGGILCSIYLAWAKKHLEGKHICIGF